MIKKQLYTQHIVFGLEASQAARPDRSIVYRIKLSNKTALELHSPGAFFVPKLRVQLARLPVCPVREDGGPAYHKKQLDRPGIDGGLVSSQQPQGNHIASCQQETINGVFDAHGKGAWCPTVPCHTERQGQRA